MQDDVIARLAKMNAPEALAILRKLHVLAVDTADAAAALAEHGGCELQSIPLDSMT